MDEYSYKLDNFLFPLISKILNSPKKFIIEQWFNLENFCIAYAELTTALEVAILTRNGDQ